MISAPLPVNEAQRLAALRSYDILDTAYETTFDDIARLASRLINTPVALVTLIDSDRAWFKARHGIDGREASRDHAFCSHAILDTAPLVVADATTDPRFSGNPFVAGDPYFRFYAGAPLVNPQGFALGTLCVFDTRARAVSAEQLDTLSGLARTVGTTLELHRAMQAVRRMALTDPLTSLANRAAFIDVLDRMLTRTPNRLELLCIDLDCFKTLNDTFGHAAGDAALVAVADVLRSVVRSQDFAARIGGDEFVVICEHGPGAAVADLAERIRAAIEMAMQRRGWPVTASIGSALFDAPVDFDAAMAVADGLMYAAKAAGRNRVASGQAALRAA